VGLSEKRTGPQLAALSSGELDVALVYGRPVTSEFAHHRLLRVQLVAVVGQDHRWAGRPGVPFAEIAQHQCILFDREQCPAMYDAILSSAQRCGITLNVSDNLDDSEATAIVVSVKPLVGFASMSRGLSVSSDARRVRPVVVQLYDPVPVIDLYAVWRAGDDNPLVDIFLACIEAVRPFDAPGAGRAETRIAG
jgi:DNA-binding transcriptional LysR family regulator